MVSSGGHLDIEGTSGVYSWRVLGLRVLCYHRDQKEVGRESAVRGSSPRHITNRKVLETWESK